MKRNYLTVIDNTVAQKMIANAYAFFKNKNLCLGSPAEVNKLCSCMHGFLWVFECLQITAKCLGISRNQVIKYKNFTDASARKIKRKRQKKATSDLDPNIKREVRLVLYDMVQNSKTYIKFNFSDAIFFQLEFELNYSIDSQRFNSNRYNKF